MTNPVWWTPHEYQKRGVEQLMKGSAALLLDPGMGKTVTTLAAFDYLRKSTQYTEHPVHTMLVVAPIKPMYDTWPRECAKWLDFEGLRCKILHGPKKQKALDEALFNIDEDAPNLLSYDILLVNPEGLIWYMENTTPEERPQVLCIDESTKFKNSQSVRFKRLKQEMESFTHKWILTGTVVPNGLMDLWSQFYIVDEGEALGKYVTHYRNNYFYKGGWGGYDYRLKDNAMEDITKLIAPKVLRLDANDYLKMPELINVTRPVTLPKTAMTMYKKVETEFMTDMGAGTIVAKNAAAAGTKCRQVANGAVYVEEGGHRIVHNAKFEALAEILEETNGQPILILYEFKHDKERIMEYLGKDAKCITGVKGAALAKVVDAFNSGELPYMVAHAGSLHGMNIQGYCRHMVWFCIPWNLENYMQAVWRLYRQGQQLDKPVMCYHLVAEGTLDETVVEVLASKGATQDQLQELLKASIG